MKQFRSEFAHNYGTYTFGYANYAKREAGEALSEIYESGYLPYSGAREVRDTFYMARSARLNLKFFQSSSENRRIAKKFDGVFTKERAPLERVRNDETFLLFCLDYFEKRHGKAAMPRERLELILDSGVIRSVVLYKKDSSAVAYVLEVSETKMGHYWYSFYDLSLMNQSLGMWLMLDCVRDAKEKGLTYYYLGTVYGEKALYKTNFEGLEWWDGTSWNSDVAKLRELGRSDNGQETAQIDAWKNSLSRF